MQRKEKFKFLFAPKHCAMDNLRNQRALPSMDLTLEVIQGLLQIDQENFLCACTMQNMQRTREWQKDCVGRLESDSHLRELMSFAN